MSKSDDKKEAIARLLLAVEPGDTVYSILRHVSRSGMQREISLVVVDRVGITPPVSTSLALDALHGIDYWVASAMGLRIGKKGGIVVTGCGMDMGFHTVYNLGRTLWPNGTLMPHGMRNGVPDHDGGYALKQRWL